MLGCLANDCCIYCGSSEAEQEQVKGGWEEGSGREDAGELQESEWWEVVERGGDKRSGGDMEK